MKVQLLPLALIPDVAQSAEAARSERVQCGFESLGQDHAIVAEQHTQRFEMPRSTVSMRVQVPPMALASIEAFFKEK